MKIRPLKMVGTLCLLLAFASTDLWAQGEVVFSDWDWAVRSAQVIRRHAAVADSLLAARHGQAQERLQARQFVRFESVTQRLSPNASGQEVHDALQRMDSLRRALPPDAGLTARGGEERWTRVAELLQEWTDVLASLPKDSVSQPFVSPLGVHLLRWTDCRSEEPLEAARERLEAWADRSRTSAVPFHTSMDSLCALYPDAADELRALRDQMLAEIRGVKTGEQTPTDPSQMTKAERKAWKKAQKESAKQAKQKAREARKAAKRKKIVKKQ
jgi:peptidyl-prolyl cis-trans isomerase SurA